MEPEKSLGKLLETKANSETKLKHDLVEQFKDMALPDHDLMAERCVVGSLLLCAEESWPYIEETGVRPSDFFDKRHGFVFEAIEKLKRKNKEINSLTVIDELNKRARLLRAGGPVFVSKIAGDSLHGTSFVRSYSTLVVEKAKERKLSEKLFAANLDLQSGKSRVLEVIDNIRRDMSEIEVRGGASTFNMEEITKNVLASLPSMGGKRKTMPTGFIDLDNLIGGFSGGDLIIVAGRPSMGKTCWGLDVARHVALEKQKPVLIFSLEMTSEQLTERLIGAESRVSTKAPTLNTKEKSDLITAAGIIADSPIMIDDAAGLSVAEIRSRTRKISNTTPLSLVVVDYIQLLTSSRDLSNRAGEMSETSNGLKRLARELKVPVIAISQLNRGPESRLDKRPLMSDLRESGAIEQDADMVMLLYREEYYGKDKTPEEAKGIAEFIVSKNRNGPTGMVRLKFESEIPKFENLSKSEVIYSHEYND